MVERISITVPSHLVAVLFILVSVDFVSEFNISGLSMIMSVMFPSLDRKEFPNIFIPSLECFWCIHYNRSIFWFVSPVETHDIFPILSFILLWIYAVSILVHSFYTCAIFIEPFLFWLRLFCFECLWLMFYILYHSLSFLLPLFRHLKNFICISGLFYFFTFLGCSRSSI